MKILIVILTIFISTLSLSAQTVIRGTITDSKGEPLMGANVFIKGSYDGTAALSDGSFSLKTLLGGNQVIVATFIGFAAQEREAEIILLHCTTAPNGQTDS